MQIPLLPSVRPAPQRLVASKPQRPAAWPDFYLTVLLVDDDPGVRSALSRVLTNDGLHVVTAASGHEALWSIELYAPDLVITDLCMSQTDGWELLAREKRLHPNLPIFVISALSARATHGANGAADAFFQKPLDLDALLTAIHRLAGNSF